MTEPTSVAEVAIWISSGTLTGIAAVVWKTMNKVSTLTTEFRIWKKELDMVLYDHNGSRGLISKVNGLESAVRNFPTTR